MKRNKAVRFAALTLAAVLAVALPGCSAGAATLAGPAVGMPARAEPETRIFGAVRAVSADFTAQTGAEALCPGGKMYVIPCEPLYCPGLGGHRRGRGNAGGNVPITGGEGFADSGCGCAAPAAHAASGGKALQRIWPIPLWMREGVDFL